MLSIASNARIYSGPKKIIWLEVLTLVHFLRCVGEKGKTVLKQKPLKGISTSFRVHSLKILKETLRKKSKQRKRRSS